jgi:hypothetical protein
MSTMRLAIGLCRAGVRVFWSIFLLPNEYEFVDELIGVDFGFAFCGEVVRRRIANLAVFINDPPIAVEAVGLE